MEACACGVSGESMVRFDHKKGARGEFVCYSCKPKTGWERLAERFGESCDSGGPFPLDKIADSLDERDALKEKEGDVNRLVLPIAMALFEERPEMQAIRAKVVPDVPFDVFFAKAWARGGDPANGSEHAAKVASVREARRIVFKMRARREGMGWEAEKSPAGYTVTDTMVVARGFAGMVPCGVGLFINGVKVGTE